MGELWGLSHPLLQQEGKGADYPRTQSVIILRSVFSVSGWSNHFTREYYWGRECSTPYALNAAVRNKENTSSIFCCRHVCKVWMRKQLPLEQIMGESALPDFSKGGIGFSKGAFGKDRKCMGVCHFWEHSGSFG